MSNARTEVRLSGFGGQGIMIAGSILGRAAVVFDEKNACLTRSYGPEARGGASKCDVVISEADIDCPVALCPDILVVLSHPAYIRYAGEMAEDGLLIVDANLVHLGDVHKTERVIQVPFTRTAEQLGRRIVANMIMLGAFSVITEVISREATILAVTVTLPERLRMLNVRALNRGFTLGEEVRGRMEEPAPAPAR